MQYNQSGAAPQTDNVPVYTSQEAALAWANALVGVTIFLVIAAFIGAGNMFSDYQFNIGAAFAAAITVVIPMLPWIGLFHVLGRRKA